MQLQKFATDDYCNDDFVADAADISFSVPILFASLL